MIKNFLCETCEKQYVCKWVSILEKNFSDESKKKIGVDIEILKCQEYQKMEE
ncbi:MAG: hypothetical protein AB7E09_08275 [Candidatus Izemoplasmatales bacterium]